MNMKDTAFTLIELLIVAAIIGILTAIAVSNFMNAQIRAKVARVEAELKTCATVIELYRLDRGYYPAYNNCKDIHPAPHFLPFSLTAPMAYLSSLFDEIFPARNDLYPPRRRIRIHRGQTMKNPLPDCTVSFPGIP